MQPTEVRNDRDTRSLGISWDDGKTQSIPYVTLRGYCPCAHCQGHGGGPKKYVTPAENIGLESIKAVGLYALQLRFSDGHGTGLYTFEYLRDLGEART
jgi:DUF971 family protein